MDMDAMLILVKPNQVRWELKEEFVLAKKEKPDMHELVETDRDRSSSPMLQGSNLFGFWRQQLQIAMDGDSQTAATRTQQRSMAMAGAAGEGERE
ncbi:hypothetical protein V6N13_082302 [Hibiscus sabdariffa]|uniref:Uncharacterized protein n=1 Tax=Hibiscus sabdariffa TaxID=183260 RepID=A0ABR2Q330_9ROSI